MSTPRYVLCPGPVVSRRDGGIHFVGARELAKLYDVPLSHCLLMPHGTAAHVLITRRDIRRRAVRERLRLLVPRSDGDYSRMPLPPTEEGAL